MATLCKIILCVLCLGCLVVAHASPLRAQLPDAPEPNFLLATAVYPIEPDAVGPHFESFEPTDAEPLLQQGFEYAEFECGEPGCRLHRSPSSRDQRNGLLGLTRRASLFLGVHGFKGPTDFGRNGNFGFHEGINFGAPLIQPWNVGYQVGFQAVHSNFAGSQLGGGGPLPQISPADRRQLFFTGGVFHRVFGEGVQSGVVVDFFHDSYYGDSNLFQIRNETAFVLSDRREIGYWGAYGLNEDFLNGLGKFDSALDPTDLFAVFYRRHFTGGGRGRIWAGISGRGDGVCGINGTIPLGTSWALENNFTYLLPKQGTAGGAQAEETWSVSIQLVWYPGRNVYDVFNDTYHPLFAVADNSWFLVDRRGK